MSHIENIHPSDWTRVKRKAMVKRIVAAIVKADREIASIYISPAFGSVYIEVGVEFDADYGWVETQTIRIADHERTSGDHAYPDFNIFDNASFEEAMADLAA